MIIIHILELRRFSAPNGDGQTSSETKPGVVNGDEQGVGEQKPGAQNVNG